jgi:hypothetical protein
MVVNLESSPAVCWNTPHHVHLIHIALYEVFLLCIRNVVAIKIEWYINIRFLRKLKKTTTKTYQLLHEVYGGDTLLRAHFFKWHKLFLEGREEVEAE